MDGNLDDIGETLIDLYKFPIGQLRLVKRYHDIAYKRLQSVVNSFTVRSVYIQGSTLRVNAVPLDNRSDKVLISWYYNSDREESTKIITGGRLIDLLVPSFRYLSELKEFKKKQRDRIDFYADTRVTHYLNFSQNKKQGYFESLRTEYSSSLGSQKHSLLNLLE